MTTSTHSISEKKDVWVSSFSEAVWHICSRNEEPPNTPQVSHSVFIIFVE